VNIQDYSPSGVTIKCQTETQLGDSTQSGVLACTDSRLIFLRDKSVLDIKTTHISEVQYEPRPFPADYIIYAVTGVSVFLGSWYILPDIELIPSIFTEVGILMGFVIALAFFIGAFLRYKPTLKVSTFNNIYEFRGGDLSSFPNAIQE